jgi:hypothetical protein
MEERNDLSPDFGQPQLHNSAKQQLILGNNCQRGSFRLALFTPFKIKHTNEQCISTHIDRVSNHLCRCHGIGYNIHCKINYTYRKVTGTIRSLVCTCELPSTPPEAAISIAQAISKEDCHDCLQARRVTPANEENEVKKEVISE